jgi:hypothetical protein
MKADATARFTPFATRALAQARGGTTRIRCTVWAEMRPFSSLYSLPFLALFAPCARRILSGRGASYSSFLIPRIPIFFSLTRRGAIQISFSRSYPLTFSLPFLLLLFFFFLVVASRCSFETRIPQCFEAYCACETRRSAPGSNTPSDGHARVVGRAMSALRVARLSPRRPFLFLFYIFRPRFILVLLLARLGVPAATRGRRACCPVARGTVDAGWVHSRCRGVGARCPVRPGGATAQTQTQTQMPWGGGMGAPALLRSLLLGAFLF